MEAKAEAKEKVKAKAKMGYFLDFQIVI